MRQTNDVDFSKVLTYLAKLVAAWLPILVGIGHQIAMLFGRGRENSEFYDQIPVFLDPPGTIGPFVTLEYQWWLVLTIFTATCYLLVVSRRLPNLPRRFGVPFYVYLLFLLILVKPI